MHPSASREKRFPRDLLLREHGFRIHSRPQKGPVLWHQWGWVFTEEHALELILQGKVKEGPCPKKRKR